MPPPSNSVRVHNGRRFQEGLKVPFPADWIYRQRDFLPVQAKHMILSVIFKTNPVLWIKIAKSPIESSVHLLLS